MEGAIGGDGTDNIDGNYAAAGFKPEIKDS